MAVEGHVLISIPLTVQRALKARGWVRNSVSYGFVIANAFKRVDELELENADLKRKALQIDDIQTQVTNMATSFVGKINGNQ